MLISLLQDTFSKDKVENADQINVINSTVSVNSILGPQYFLQENGYEVQSLIGWGQLGPLMRAHQVNKREEVAIKKFYVDEDEESGSFFQLFYGLSLLTSPYFVNLKALLVDIVNQCVYLVMEYFPNGNLGDYIKENKHISSAQISEIFISIIKGLLFLKENNISHGNLKLSNILIGSNGSPILTDFGLTGLCQASNVFKEKQKLKLKFPSIKNQNTFEQPPCFRSDLEAAGMILWALCGNSDISEIYAVQNGNIPDISQRNHQSFLKLAFEMMGQDSTNNHTSLETILSELQKLQEPSQNVTIKEDERQPQPFQMYLKMNQTHSLEFIKQISQLELEKYQNMSHLSLDLNSSQLGNTQTKSLLSPLSHFLNLQTLALDLSGNIIGADEAQHLLQPLANFIKLVSLSLNLNKNKIGDIGAQSLLLPLKDLINLESFRLSLYNNLIGAIGAQSLLSPLANLIKLKSVSLDLQSNTIKDAGAQTLLLPIANLVNLSDLFLSLNSNEIEDSGAKSLLLPLQKLHNLTILDLDLFNNSIESTGGQYLLRPIADLINLTKISLNLYCNQIGPIGASSLLLPLSKLSNLTFLSLCLWGCTIRDEGAQSLLLSIADLTNLSRIFLNLTQNKITDTGFQSLFHPLMHLKKLTNLSITAYDNYREKEMEHIFKIMFKTTDIKIEIVDPFLFFE